MDNIHRQLDQGTSALLDLTAVLDTFDHDLLTHDRSLWGSPAVAYLISSPLGTEGSTGGGGVN